MAELDAERIAAAALRVVDKLGADGFTMRAVADELSVTPMALYHHVEDKAALVTLMVDADVRQRVMPPPTGDWKEDLLEMARWMRSAAHAHPTLGQLRRRFHVWTPSILPMTERWLSLWHQSGLDLERASVAAAMSRLAIVGAVEEAVLASGMPPPDDTALAMFPNARLLLHSAPDPETSFELLVRSVIDGLHARLLDGDLATNR